jgi:YidC/Oxa1 family membrane protein insertase
MNFAEIIYQSALFTATFFIFNKLFSRYVFKNREAMPMSMGKIFSMFVMYLVLGFSINFFVEKYREKPQSEAAQSLVSGQSMQAPAMTSDSVAMQAPLMLDIDFAIDHDKEELTTVKTDLAEYVFANNGATLESMTLLWQNGKRVDLLTPGQHHFALAFDSASPVNFKLISSTPSQDGTAHRVVYQATRHHAIIEKKFIVYKNSYQLDVMVSCKGLDSEQTLRLFVPTPAMSDDLHGIVNDANVSTKMKLVDIALNTPANLQQFWFKPKLFGFSSRFFTNVCFAWAPQAIGRVYFKETHEKQYQAIFESQPCKDDIKLAWSFYFGPKTAQNLQAVAPQLGCVVEYGFLKFLAKPLAYLLLVFKDYLGSYGWAIILVALLIKLIMVPFTLRGERSMQKQAEFDKKRIHLQQKYKHDKAALDKAMTELIQKNGLPILSGCLPMLLNIPVFIALNKVLTSSTELYGASFLWLPDLSVADPYYILSLMTFVGMIFAPGIQTGPRQMFSKMGFALLLAAVTSYLASGLALFVVCNTLFGVVQSAVVTKFRALAGR